MSVYYLRKGLHHCVIEDAVILLDETAGKYLAVPAEYCPAFISVSKSGRAACEPAPSLFPETSVHARQINMLIELGILTESADDGTEFFEPRNRTRSELVGNLFSASDIRTSRSKNLTAFGLALCSAIWSTRFVGFRRIVRYLDRRHQRFVRHAAANLAYVEALAAAFRRMRVWTYTASQACLFDALVLSGFLYRRGVPARVILGVRTKPFCAHAWVQWGDVVINDTLERISEYTPILVK